MSIIDEILTLLEDGEWHSLEEIGDKTRLYDIKVRRFTEFLSSYDIVKLDKSKRKVKLNFQTLNFFKKIRQVEGNENH